MSPPTKNRLLAAQLACFISIALLWPTEGSTMAQTPADPTRSARAEASTPYRLALTELGRLEKHEGTFNSRQQILVRNLSRYFVTYLVPPTADELQRVLGTTQRMTQQAARLFYRSAKGLAQSQAADRITTEHVAAATQRLLPRTSGPAGEWIYFPGSSPTPLETWDLEALLRAGLAWEVLGFLADAEVAADEHPLPMDEDAARLLAESLNAYGLLLFRLGGEHARISLAPHLGTQHLRLAGKTIAARASGERAAIGAIGPRPPPPPEQTLFEDVTDSSGIDFLHVTSDWLSRHRRFGPMAPTFSGGGTAAGDVDGDGWDDLVFCGGDGCSLYLNQGNGDFRDYTEASGIHWPGEARMPLLADFDNDGDKDLFITYARDTNRLWINQGDGRFFDGTEGSGLEREGDISGPAAAVDVDNDGLLDLYVGNFGDYLEGASAWVAPDAKNALPNRLYRNLGKHSGTPALAGRDAASIRFVDVSDQAGVGDRGWSQALSHFDYDGDGDQDLYIANDFGRNQLLSNLGDGSFSPSGSATGADDPNHGMNVAFADLNRDRLPDIFVTNIWFWASAKQQVTETNTLLLSNREGDVVSYRSSEEPSLIEHDSGWAWAALFFDVENDGDDDLFIANGFTDYMTFVQYRQHPELPDQLYATNNGREENLFFLNDRGSVLPTQRIHNSGLELPGINSRSTALLDFDRDGDLDLALTSFHERARLFRNDAANRSRNNWLQIDLVGDPERGVNRDAIGAVVIASSLEDPNFYAWRSVTGGEGYLGASTTTVELGLGKLARVDLEVIWPVGASERVSAIPANQRIQIHQGSASYQSARAPRSGSASDR